MVPVLYIQYYHCVLCICAVRVVELCGDVHVYNYYVLFGKAENSDGCLILL